MERENVQKLYSCGQAHWYKPFMKNIWNPLIANKAENEFIKFVTHNINEKKSILEIGCGIGRNLETILKNKLKFKSYTGIDFSESMLKIADRKYNKIKNVKFIKKDVSDLSSLNSKFDIIICTWVLSHVENPSSVVNYAQKLLKKKGKLFLTFLSRPKGFFKFLLNPLLKYIFQSEYIKEKEINLFKNIYSTKKISSGFISIIEIH